MPEAQVESDILTDDFSSFFSVSMKVTLLVVFTALVTASVLGGFLYLRMVDEIMATKKKELRVEAQYASDILESTIDKIERDLLVLRKTPPIQGIIRTMRNNGKDPLDGSTIEQWKDRLASIFVPVSEQERSYVQIRYIGIEDGGREIVRVNKGLQDGDEPVVVSDSALQRKSGEPYFKDALELKPGEIYYSPINLNVENGKVQVPYMVVVRVLVPVFDGDQLFGMLVINASYDSLFGEFFDRLQQGYSVFVMTDNKNVAHFNKEKGQQEFLHHYQADSRTYTKIFEKFILSSQQSGAYFQEFENEDYFFSFFKHTTTDKGNAQDYVVALAVPEQEIFSSLNKLRFQALVAVLITIFVLTVFSFYLSRLFMRPLKGMIEEIRKHDGSHANISLPVKLKDEIGELARAYKNQLLRLQRSERAEKQAFSRLEAVVESTVDGIITIDDFGRIETYNSACVNIFGFSREEVKGKNINMLMPEPYHSDHDTYLSNYKKTGEKQIIGIGREVSGQRKNGEIFPLELSVSEITVQGRRVFSGIVRDITLRKKSEDSILRSNEELERFAYIASHDLQEPLRMITNFVHLLEEDCKENFDEKGSEYLHFITDAASRMQELIEGILTYSRLNQDEAKNLEFDCNVQMRVVLNNLRDSIEQKHAVIDAKNLPKIHGNPLNFTRLLQNLVSNALKYSQDDVAPLITVKAQDKGHEWLFSVQDNGIGIKEEYSDQIFVIFKRLHGKQAYKGTGIGLAACKRIIESMDGKIWVESVYGEGSTFFFTVPK